MKCRKYKDLDFTVVDDDGETVPVLGVSGHLPSQLLHWPGRWRSLQMTRVLQVACETPF